MRRLRVLISVLSAKNYGGDTYFRLLLPALARRPDIDCVVVAPDERFAPHCPAGSAVKLLRVAVPGIFRGPARIAWEQVFLPRLAREYGAQLVFTATNSGLLMGRVPCVIGVYNMEPLTAVWPGTPALMRIRLALLSRVTRASALAATRIVAASNFVRDSLQELGVPENKIDVIYSGADDLPRPDLTLPRSGGFLAAAMKFVRYANIETMIRAYARLRKDGYRGELRVAGGPHDAGYEREIRSLVRKLDLEDAVRFLGYRPRDEVCALMRESDAFLFPSTLEACPLTLIEAMSQGAAIVATTAPPMPEFAAEGAILVPPSDDAAFAVATLQAMGDPALRVRARARADAFRWDDTAERLTRCWSKAAQA